MLSSCFTGFSLAAFKRNKRKLELAEKVETDLIQLKKRRQSNEKVSLCFRFCCVTLTLQLVICKFHVLFMIRLMRHSKTLLDHPICSDDIMIT